jgi:hypothetical protein
VCVRARARACVRVLDEVNERPLRRGRPVTSDNAWSLESDPDSDSELMSTSTASKGGGGRSREQESSEWCIQLCCRSIVVDMSACYRDMLMTVSCREPPTLRCGAAACCVLYCGLIAVGIFALMTLAPGQKKD